jgi:predicted dehydrogenase
MMGQEHLRNLALVPGVEVAAIHDPDPMMLAAGRALVPGARVAEGFGDLLREDVDALVVASPNHFHAAQLAEVARGRPMPVLMEKPLYVDPAEGQALAALGDAFPVWVAMEYRYMPPIAALLERVEEVTGGIRMLTIREHRFPFLPKVGDWNRFNARTGGTLVEKCCHFFDLMRLVLRAEPVRVMASAGQAVNHLGELYDGLVPDVWDHAYVIVDFDTGARAMLELSMFAEGSRFQEEITAVGPSGKIEARVPGPTRFWPEASGPAPIPEVEVSPRAPKGPRRLEMPVDPVLLAAGDHNGATYHQHLRFAEVVRGHAPVEVTLRDGARAVEMGHAAQEAAGTGEVVRMGAAAPPPAGRPAASARPH